MEHDVTCSCGKVFRAKSERARHCSSTCRSRASRAGTVGPSARVVAFGTVPVEPSAPTEGESEPALVTATRIELERAGQLTTALGQQALLLADRMASPFASAAAVASLAKRHSDLMTALVPPAPGKPDALDELAERRLRKVAG